VELLDVLRAPLGPGNAGKVYSVAISPDGRTIAAGGALGSQATAYSILLFDRISGRVTLTIREPDVATALAFSPDGTRLAAGLSFLGLKVYQTRDGRSLSRATDYKSTFPLIRRTISHPCASTCSIAG
jgi:WD40 repeat protein